MIGSLRIKRNKSLKCMENESENKQKKYDNRHPEYFGEWHRSIPYKDEGFAQDLKYDEPHNKRRIAILNKYPHVKNLFGPSSKTKYVILLAALAHIFGLYLASKIQNMWLFIILAYFYGGTLTALSGITIHECTHLLAAQSAIWNNILGFIANLPIIIPIHASFKKYHLLHHKSLGVYEEDPDMPLEIEYRLVRGNMPLKCIYILFYPFLYLFRSIHVRKVPILDSEIYNSIFHITCLLLSYRFFGLKSIAYLTLSTYFGYSLHPAAAHLIQEHFTFKDGQETYSYYGPFNRFFLNIGYHVEHHDFCNIAWDKLPLLKKAAPDFYDKYSFQTSWFGVFYIFLTQATMGPQSRVQRSQETAKKANMLEVPNS